MSEFMEVIYDKYIAEEKLKNGTKYERLAAVIYKSLDQQSVVIHDLRLRGKGKTAEHQIDVTIEKDNFKKRILVECKDYDKVVGISVIRDFYGAVSQIKPDEAIVVTTNGFTKGAVKFAQDEEIQLAVLREFRDEDWEGRIREIHIKMGIKSLKTPKITWVIDKGYLEIVREAVKDKESHEQYVSTVDNFFYDESGKVIKTYQEILQPIINSLPTDHGEISTGRYEFDEPMFINMFGKLLKVIGFDYELTYERTVINQVIDDGNKVALLIFKLLDGSVDRVIFDRDIKKWTFDDSGEVIEKIYSKPDNFV